MKKFIIFLLMLVAGIVSFQFCDKKATEEIEKQRVSAEREQFIADSLEAVRIAMLSSKNGEIIKNSSANFRIDKDEFRDLTFIEPKSAPKYRNRNGVYCYISVNEKNIPENLRFVFQYYADDWLFIERMTFNVDGENISVYPLNKHRDCGDGGMIWEWCDEVVDTHVDTNPSFIEKLSNATSVKVKLSGSDYYDTKTLSAAQIKSIKDTYELYLSLGGKFE